MPYWTFRSLLEERASVCAAAFGIALALLLALYLDAVFRGEAGQLVAFIEKTPGDVWVLQKGVENLHMTQSTLTENAVVAVAQTDGVAAVARYIYRASTVGERGMERMAYVVGVPDDASLRRQWEEATGWRVPQMGAATLPEPILKSLKLEIGGTVRIGDRNYVVGGVSQGAFSMANPLIFINERDARKQFEVGDGASILLVEGVPEVMPKVLAARISSETSGVRALLRSELVRNDFQLALEMGGALIGMMSLIGMMVAALIVIFTAYAFISDRTAELAVAKALGASRSQLVLSAALQTGVVAAIGAVLAFIATGPMEYVLTVWLPDVAVNFSSYAAFRLGMATFIVAELASIVPAYFVLRVDPALVFRA